MIFNFPLYRKIILICSKVLYDSMVQIDKNKEYVIEDFVYTNYINLSHLQKMAIFEARNMPIVREKMYNTEPLLLESHLSFIDSLNNRNDRYYWYITKDDKYVGSFNVTDINEEECSCESGIFFKDTSLKGMNCNIRLAFNTICFMFECLGMEKVVGYVKEGNTFNIQMNNFFGFEKEGCANGYEKISMNKTKFLTIDRESINLRSYLKFIKQ